MNIITTKYKNIPAIRLENSRYCLTVLPGEGAKIVSFQTIDDNREFLWQNPANVYGHIGLNDNYVAGECSSFDDMFPTIDPITLSSGSRAGVEYPDHGEVCRVPFSCSITDNAVILEMLSTRLNFTYRKIISETPEGEFKVHYEIVNHSDDAFASLWAGHCMINVCEGGEVISPLNDDEPVEIMFDEKNEFGSRGTVRKMAHEMKISHTENNELNSFKFYYKNPTTKGELGYRYSDGTKFFLRYDPTSLPYVGVWVNNGFFKDSFCVGLEPCNLAYDTILNAAERGQTYSIPPKSTLEFDLTFSAEKQ